MTSIGKDVVLPGQLARLALGSSWAGSVKTWREFCLVGLVGID